MADDKIFMGVFAIGHRPSARPRRRKTTTDVPLGKRETDVGLHDIIFASE
jgi:hypothetical protein